jgi:GcrA cell cycle regulator
MEPSNWAPEHSGALREYLALGMTYSEIARAINAKFNTHYTRSAVPGASALSAMNGRPIWSRRRRSVSRQA